MTPAFYFFGAMFLLGDYAYLPTSGNGIFAVRKGDPDLVFFLDAWIRHYQDTGWLAEKRKYWFESFAWEDQL